MPKSKQPPEAITPEPKPARGRPKSPGGPKPRTPIVVTIRAKPEWEAWLDDLCEEVSRRTGLGVKIDRTDSIDVALGVLASKLGIAAPPPRY